MREVFETLEGLGIRYFITGAEAAAVYGSLRQTFDTDVVMDLKPSRFGTIDQAFGDAYVATSRSIAAISPWPRSSRSIRLPRSTSSCEFPAPGLMRRWLDVSAPSIRTFGTVWVAAMEDLILAKLMWSEGTSELQLRDCGTLIRINQDEIGWPYMQRWAAVLDVAELLERVRDAP